MGYIILNGRSRFFRREKWFSSSTYCTVQYVSFWVARASDVPCCRINLQLTIYCTVALLAVLENGHIAAD